MKKRGFIAINVYWFGLAFLWNGIHPIILPALLLSFVPETLKNTYLGALTFIGLILAILIQPLSGALSDRWHSRWGRRRPWILLGTTFSLFCLIGMALSSSLFGIIITYLLLQTASNMAHGPAQGLIPDLIPSEKRGLASGIKNLFDMGGLVVTSLIAGQLMGADNPTLALMIIGAVLAISTFLTLFGTPEKSKQEIQSSSPLYLKLRDTLKVSLVDHPQYTRLIVSRLLILLGIYTIQSFAQYYIRDWLGIQNPAEATGNLMTTIGLALTLLVFPAGWLADKVSSKKLNIYSGILAAIGIFMITFVKSLTALYFVGSIIGIATGIFLSVNWTLATNLIPEEEAGKYLGLSNLATAGAGATSRLMGPLIDSINAVSPGSHIGYPITFIIASIITLIGAFLLIPLQPKTFSFPAVQNDC
jgi:Na+/melibiose symporter-like transporter